MRLDGVSKRRGLRTKSWGNTSTKKSEKLSETREGEWGRVVREVSGKPKYGGLISQVKKF